MIAIIDYGVGNLGSVKNALDSLQLESVVTSNKDIILSADKIILPGVGAFEDAMKAFLSLNLDKVLYQCIELNKPILGICVGMQMLFDESLEFGCHEGLKIFRGRIIPFDPSKGKVPHMGWNQIQISRSSKLCKGLENPYVYFVHSYHLDESKFCTATTRYCGIDFPCIVEHENIFATQFHPEKSGEIGLKILKNFGEII